MEAFKCKHCGDYGMGFVPADEPYNPDHADCMLCGSTYPLKPFIEALAKDHRIIEAVIDRIEVAGYEVVSTTKSNWAGAQQTTYMPVDKAQLLAELTNPSN